jgi:hypothetical protein
VSLLGAGLALAGLEPWLLTRLRGALDGAVVLAVLPLYVLLGLTPRLPKRIFLTLALFTGWAVLGALPLPVYLAQAQLSAVLAVLQVAMAALAFFLVRQRSGGARWLLAEQDLAPGPAWSARTAGGFALLNVAVLTPALLALLLGSAALAVNVLSAGFLRLDPSGLYASARVYERGEQTVQLVGMMHIGGREFYEAVEALLAKDNVLVLREGVSDREGHLPRGLDYGRVAGELGLDTQSEQLDLGGRSVKVADLDMADFAPRTRELLQEVGELFASRTGGEALTRYLRMSRAIKPEDLELVRRDVLARRNEHVLAELDTALAAHRAVAVPWGAAHMPELERGVLQRGFALRESRELRILEF